MEAMLEGLSHKPKMPRGMKDARKHGVHRMETELLHDGSHKTTFHHIKPGVESTTHSTGNMEALHDLLEEKLGGKPNKEELAHE